LPAAVANWKRGEELPVVVLVAIDAAADAVFATVQLPLLGLGQRAVVLGQVSLFLLLQTGFVLFEISRFEHV